MSIAKSKKQKTYDYDDGDDAEHTGFSCTDRPGCFS